jgi:glycosyltransferase involved in cell wall biosynthesis
MSLRISLITAVRNRAHTVGATMESVRAQRGADIEHVVVDGASTDGTLAVLERYRDSVASFVSEPDRGAYDALNKGIARATGDIVGFLHSDDEFASPDALAQVEAAFADPSVACVYGDLVYVRKNDPAQVVRYWNAGKYRRERLALGWMPPHPTFYVRREIYERFGAFDTRFRIAADYECMLRLLWRHQLKAAYVPSVLVRMRTGGMSNGSLFSLFRKSCEDFAALRENELSAARAVLMKKMSKLPQFIAREPFPLRAAGPNL